MKRILLALIMVLAINITSYAQISISNLVGGLRMNTDSGSISPNTVAAPCVMGTITNNSDDFLFTEFIKVDILQDGKVLYRGKIETIPSVDAIAPGEAFKFRAGGNLEKTSRRFYRYSWGGGTPVCRIIDSRSDGSIMYVLEELDIPKSQGIDRNWKPFKIVTLEEQARKKELERNFAIEHFLNLTHNIKDDKEMYDDMKVVDNDTYLFNKKQVYNVIEQTINNASVNSISVHIKDTVHITYDKEVVHNITISSTPVVEGIEKELLHKITALQLNPAKMQIPDTDTTVTINSFAAFDIGYKVENKEHIIELKRIILNDIVSFVSGDERYYNANKSQMEYWFGDTYGKYTIRVVEKFVNGESVQYDVSLHDKDKKDKVIEVTDESKITKPEFEGKEASVNLFAEWLRRRIGGGLYEYSHDNKVKIWLELNRKGDVTHVVVTYRPMPVRSEAIKELVSEVINSSSYWWAPAKYDGKPIPWQMSFTYTLY